MIQASKTTPFAVVAIVALASTAATGRVNADSRCRPVRAHIETTITTQGCTSPVGICTVGHVEGGPFDGATTFLTAGAAQSAGMPNVEPAANLSYSGTFTMTSPHGTFVTSDLGVLDASHAAFVEMMRSVSGTGRFTNPTGTLFLSGALVNEGTGFDGTITGELCTDRPDGDD
jgi:hypothetical protein